MAFRVGSIRLHKAAEALFDSVLRGVPVICPLLMAAAVEAACGTSAVSLAVARQTDSASDGSRWSSINDRDVSTSTSSFNTGSLRTSGLW